MIKETLKLTSSLNFDARLSNMENLFLNMNQELVKLTVIINSLETRINKIENDNSKD